MKDLEVKMLAELVKNSKRSDRELAKVIGVSQPTATRIRSKLEKEGCIKEYVAIPDFEKIGYNIMAITLMKLNRKSLRPQGNFEFKKTHFDAIGQLSQSVVFLVKQGTGLGYDAAILSIHPTFAAFDNFQRYVKEQMSIHIVDFNSFLVNLEYEKDNLPITFKLMANQILLTAGDAISN